MWGMPWRKGVAQGDGLEPLPQATMAVDDRSHHCQAGMGSIDLTVALLENEGHGRFTCWVKMENRSQMPFYAMIIG